VAVVARTKLEHSGEEDGRHAHPAAVPGFRDSAGNPPAATRLVDVAPRQLLELADAHTGRVENQKRETVGAHKQPVDGFHMLGGGRLNLGPCLPR
jgi:hypothetical protein